MFKFKEVDANDMEKISRIRNHQQGSDKSINILGVGPAAKSTFTFPHQLYTLGLADLEKPGLPAPVMTGTRVIEAIKNNFSFIYDLNETAEGSQPQMFKNKEFLVDYEQAFERILGSEMEEKEYEVRTLKVPALHVEALWLHKTDSPADDLYYPVRKMDDVFQPAVFYNAASFFSILRTLAVRNEPDDKEGKMGMKGG
ncbi:MAG: hypothetical protein ABWZ25_15065 [Chitinophagaceae bacterium]